MDKITIKLINKTVSILNPGSGYDSKTVLKTCRPLFEPIISCVVMTLNNTQTVNLIYNLINSAVTTCEQSLKDAHDMHCAALPTGDQTECSNEVTSQCSNPDIRCNVEAYCKCVNTVTINLDSSSSNGINNPVHNYFPDEKNHDFDFPLLPTRNFCYIEQKPLQNNVFNLLRLITFK